MTTVHGAQIMTHELLGTPHLVDDAWLAEDGIGVANVYEQVDEVQLARQA